MKQLLATLILLFGVCLSANADVWKWVDAFGKTHFVNTMTPIFTWGRRVRKNPLQRYTGS